MKRREFIAGVGAAVWPAAARGQQPTLPVIGYLSPGSSTTMANVTAAFLEGIKDGGYIEGRNVAIEYRWAENRYERLPALAADLVRQQVAVIAAFPNTAAALAAKAATATIPVVFAVGADPVTYGLVLSFNRPGGNITGVSFLTTLLVPKQFQMLHELVPKAPLVAVLENPTNVYSGPDIRNVEDAARALGQNVYVLNASTEGEIDAAFTALVQRQAGALQIPGDSFFWTRREQIVGLAARHAVPTIYAQREFVDIGGLMSYGTDATDGSRLVGRFVARILKGEKPADLPVQQVTKVELVINMKTAKALGLTVPLPLLALADEVIE
jgi:putative tryptophan/tyrosine transport system substrate-binding protein